MTAFQAVETGSIPVTRSNLNIVACPQDLNFRVTREGFPPARP